MLLFAAAFGDSDDDDVNPEDVGDEAPGSLHAPSSPASVSYPPAPPEAKDFPGASCDTKLGAGDGSRWWYINSTAMKWATSQ